ncbi:MAG TPA: hypothetical protein VIG64_07175 [Actinomycetota bacterium]
MVEMERQHRSAAPQRPTHLLIAPLAVPKAIVQEYRHGVAITERRLDHLLPFEARFDVVVRNERLHAVTGKSTSDYTCKLSVYREMRHE